MLIQAFGVGSAKVEGLRFRLPTINCYRIPTVAGKEESRQRNHKCRAGGTRVQKPAGGARDLEVCPGARPTYRQGGACALVLGFTLTYQNLFFAGSLKKFQNGIYNKNLQTSRFW